MQQFEPFAVQLGTENHDTGDIAARSSEAHRRRFPARQRPKDHDRNSAGRLAGGADRGAADRDDCVGFVLNQFLCQAPERVGVSVPLIENEISALLETELRQLRHGDLAHPLQ